MAKFDLSVIARAAVVPAVIATLLAPGFLVSVPPVGGKYFMTKQTSLVSALIHGILIAVVTILVQENLLA